MSVYQEAYHLPEFTYDYEKLKIEQRGPVYICSFNDADNLNAMSYAQMAEFNDFLIKVRMDKDCRVIVLTGGRVACEGAPDEALSLAGLLEHLKRLYAQKGIALQYRTEEGACFLEPDLFKPLLVNLMDNARKALDNGGNIYVWQEMLPDGCRVRVLDNGRGIPPEALAHLTEAFYRVDKSRSRAQGGAGLGLSLCNEIVQLHGGTMQFESRVGNGTVVTVELKGGRV